MSKNLTRKGIAFGALVALGSTLLAGAPASAAGIDNGYVSLAPNTGTSYNVLADGTFDLKSNVVGSLAGTSGKDLKFFVEDSTSKTKFDADTTAQATAVLPALTVTAVERTASSTTATITATHALAVGDAVKITGQTGIANGSYKVQTISTTVSFTITTAESTAIASGAPTSGATFETGDLSDVDARGLIVASDLGSAALIGSTVTVASTIGGTATTSGRLANGSYVVDTNTNANSVDRVLRLVNTDATVTTSVVVTAWVDDNDNGAIDSTEYQSPARTVTFLKNADLTVNTTIEGPVLGAAGINATIAVTPELNGQQVGALDAPTWTLQSGSVNTNTATYNTTTKVWDVAMALTSGTIAAGNYSVKANIAGAAIGNTSTGTASTRVAADTKIEVAGTADQTYLKNTDASATITGTVSTVRKAKSATVVITSYDADAVALGAGKSVTVNFRNATTTTDWTINGTKVLDNAASGSKVYTTDAKGQVTLTVSSTDGAALDSIDVHASPENVAALDNAANAEVRLTWATASYTIVDLNAPVNGTARNVVKNGSVTFDLFAGDQWNAALTGSYRLYITATGRTSAGSNVDFANGRATYTVTDSALGSGTTITVASELQKQTSGTWASSTDATDFADVTITAVDAPGSAVIPTRTYADGTDADSVATTFDLSPVAVAVYNAETTQAGYTAAVTGAMDTVGITLPAGSGISVGDTVTVSGSGLFFAYVDASASNAVLRVSAGSLTFVLDNASDVVAVYSNKYAKDAVVTVTAAGRSGTVKVTTDVAAENSAVSAALTSPATVRAGSTFKVTAKLSDAFGNGVKVATADLSNVAVSYSGPGIVFGTLPSETDANGELSFAVLLGSADKGLATVTVSYDLNNDGDYTDTDEFVAKKSVLVAVSASVSAGSKKANVVVKNASGLAVKVVSGSKATTKTATSDNFKLSLTKLTSGSKTVKVYVNDILVASKKVTVRR